MPDCFPRKQRQSKKKLCSSSQFLPRVVKRRSGLQPITCQSHPGPTPLAGRETRLHQQPVHDLGRGCHSAAARCFTNWISSSRMRLSGLGRLPLPRIGSVAARSRRSCPVPSPTPAPARRTKVTAVTEGSMSVGLLTDLKPLSRRRSLPFRTLQVHHLADDGGRGCSSGALQANRACVEWATRAGASAANGHGLDDIVSFMTSCTTVAYGGNDARLCELRERPAVLVGWRPSLPQQQLCSKDGQSVTGLD